VHAASGQWLHFGRIAPALSWRLVVIVSSAVSNGLSFETPCHLRHRHFGLLHEHTAQGRDVITLHYVRAEPSMPLRESACATIGC
jgi:hypothetical protein